MLARPEVPAPGCLSSVLSPASSPAGDFGQGVDLPVPASTTSSIKRDSTVPASLAYGEEGTRGHG